MSKSLKEQLLQAGFSEPKVEKRPPKKRSRGKKPASEKVDEVQKRKAVKAEIKALIESVAVKEYAGDNVFRFTVQNRIRELHVKEEIRSRLVAGSLVITRLNGATFLIPQESADGIRKLNPNWAIVTPAKDSSETADVHPEYEDFPIPDDLQW